MKKLLVTIMALCLSASVFAQFAAGGKVGFNFNGVTGQKKFIDLLPSSESERKYYSTNPMGLDAELFAQYDFERFGFEVDFGLTNRQGLIAEYEKKYERTKTIYNWNGYFDYTTYEVSPMIRLFTKTYDNTKMVLAAGPNFVFTKDTTRYGENSNTIKTPEAFQNTFNYGLRAEFGMEAPLSANSFISMGLNSVFDFKNTYKASYNELLFDNLLKKRVSVNFFFGLGLVF